MDEEIRAYYETGAELERLTGGSSLIEFLRTKEVLERFLPPPPARVLDVGGGPGAYADWLADKGYAVRLVDLTPLHVTHANERAGGRFEAVLGDARELEDPDSSYDVVLLLGPLYHLVERGDRIRALREAGRVARPGALVAAAAISRLAPLLDTFRSRALREDDVRIRGEETLETGVHRPPADRTGVFTTSFFHRPDELATEVQEARLDLVDVFGLEGPCWIDVEALADERGREDILYVARMLERDPTAIGTSGHLLAIAHA